MNVSIGTKNAFVSPFGNESRCCENQRSWLVSGSCLRSPSEPMKKQRRKRPATSLIERALKSRDLAGYDETRRAVDAGMPPRLATAPRPEAANGAETWAATHPVSLSEGSYHKSHRRDVRIATRSLALACYVGGAKRHFVCTRDCQVACYKEQKAFMSSHEIEGNPEMETWAPWGSNNGVALG